MDKSGMLQLTAERVAILIVSSQPNVAAAKLATEMVDLRIAWDKERSYAVELEMQLEESRDLSSSLRDQLDRCRDRLVELR